MTLPEHLLVNGIFTCHIAAEGGDRIARAWFAQHVFFVPNKIELKNVTIQPKKIDIHSPHDRTFFHSRRGGRRLGSGSGVGIGGDGGIGSSLLGLSSLPHFVTHREQRSKDTGYQKMINERSSLSLLFTEKSWSVLGFLLGSS
jgi:hypothetical protein